MKSELVTVLFLLLITRDNALLQRSYVFPDASCTNDMKNLETVCYSKPTPCNWRGKVLMFEVSKTVWCLDPCTCRTSCYFSRSKHLHTNRKMKYMIEIYTTLVDRVKAFLKGFFIRIYDTAQVRGNVRT